jgi:hypothetical protein
VVPKLLRNGSTCNSNLGGFLFLSHPRLRLSWPKLSVVFLSLSRQISGIYLDYDKVTSSQTLSNSSFVYRTLVFLFGLIFCLNIEPGGSSEKSVKLYQTIRHHIPEDCGLNLQTSLFHSSFNIILHAVPLLLSIRGPIQKYYPRWWARLTARQHGLRPLNTVLEMDNV